MCLSFVHTLLNYLLRGKELDFNTVAVALVSVGTS